MLDFASTFILVFVLLCVLLCLWMFRSDKYADINLYAHQVWRVPGTGLSYQIKCVTIHTVEYRKFENETLILDQRTLSKAAFRALLRTSKCELLVQP